MGDMKEELNQMNDYFNNLDDPYEALEEDDLEPQPESEPERSAEDDSPSNESNPDPDGEPEPEQPTNEPPNEPETPEPKPAEPDPLDDLRQRNAELEERLKALEKPTPEPTPEPEPQEPEEQDFLSEIDFDEVTEDKDAFNKLMNKVYQKAVSDTRKAYKPTQGVTPEQIIRTVETYNTLQKSRDDFYTANEDLKPFEKVVGTVFEELATKNQDKTLLEVMNLTAQESRKRLGLTKPEPPTKPKPSNKPKLPRKSGQPARGQEPSSNNPLASEIEAMNKTLGL